MIGEKAAKELSIQAYEGMWLANFYFLTYSDITNLQSKK